MREGGGEGERGRGGRRRGEGKREGEGEGEGTEKERVRRGRGETSVLVCIKTIDDFNDDFILCSLSSTDHFITHVPVLFKGWWAVE